MEANNSSDALTDTQTALEKVKLQQKHQKISLEVRETLMRLRDELSKRDDESYQTIPERNYRHETTDL